VPGDTSAAVTGHDEQFSLCLAPIRADGLTTLAAWKGLAALTIAVIPSALAIIGAAAAQSASVSA
jgi:hypothetical protein